MTTSALTEVQEPLVQSDHVREGWFSAVSVPTCWALTAARRLRNATVYMMDGSFGDEVVVFVMSQLQDITMPMLRTRSTLYGR